METVTPTEVADFFRHKISPRSLGRRKLSVRFGAERKLSSRAAETLCKNLSLDASSAPPTLSSAQLEGMSLVDAVQSCRSALPGSFDPAHIDNEVRTAAELYPYGADTRLPDSPLEDNPESRESATKSSFVFFTNLEDLRKHIEGN